MAIDGQTVMVHYTGTLDDGTQFDSSRQREPLQFTIGGGQVIPGFDAAARSLEIGESVTVRLEAKDAYGEPNIELIFHVPANETPEPLEVGDRVELWNGALAVVTHVDATEIIIDANHPLAGKALTFEIELVSVR
jgi:peptidylprolyl isomerase